MSKNAIIIFICALIVAILIIIIAVVNIFTPVKTIPDLHHLSPTATPIPANPTLIDPNPPIPGQGETYKKSVEEINKKEATQVSQDAAVGKLLDFLPYQGKYFSISYNYSQATFIVTLNKNNQVQANEELDQFLQLHGIDNKSWLNNLQINIQ